MTVRRQIFLVLSALFLAVLAAVLAVSVAGTRQYLEQQLASHAQDAATAMSVTLGQALGKGDIVLAQAQVHSVFDRGYFKRIAVLGPDRQPIVNRELPEKIEGVPVWFVRLVPIETTTGEAFVGSGWRQLGKVLVDSQPTFAYQHLWTTAMEQMLWLLAFYAASLGLMSLVLHYILLPLKAIEKTARDVQVKKFEQIELRPRAPELASVVVAMNQMSRRVGEMLDAEAARAEALRKQAYDDELTGLANRRGFELQLVELLQGEHQFLLGAVVAVEIDDMRLLSRLHGFAAGEHIMRVLADGARAVFTEGGLTILARSNDFSFSFLLADLTHEQAAEQATELRQRTMAQLSDFAPANMIGINMGVAFFRQSDTRSDVFARADFAVESARQSDRNGFVVLPDAQDENSALGSFGWRTLIQSALQENRWRLVRQPVVRLRDVNELIHYECMARLVDTHGELVPASSFMPMAARHRLMTEVDRAMVTLSFERLREQEENTNTNGLAINLSPQSIGDAEFVAWLSGQLASLESGAKRVALEVSEFGALRNGSALTRVRQMARQHGVAFGIDHFGLGPQAVKMLRDVVPDYVKLSGALSQELVAQAGSNELLVSIVTLARSLDVMVIAQQIETAEQAAALSTAGVDGGQGYYFGAPQ
jgi:diguanylate cyclase (GGDEF)-like protein